MAAVLRGGGFLDTVVEDETGVFFDEPAPGPIAEAVRRVIAQTWSPDTLRARAEWFSEDRFVRRLREVADEGRAGAR